MISSPVKCAGVFVLTKVIELICRNAQNSERQDQRRLDCGVGRLEAARIIPSIERKDTVILPIVHRACNTTWVGSMTKQGLELNCRIK